MHYNALIQTLLDVTFVTNGMVYARGDCLLNTCMCHK